MKDIERLRDEGAEEELEALLGSRMPFGTAGLRAKMGAGYCHMNDLTVIQTAQVSKKIMQHQAVCTCAFLHKFVPCEAPGCPGVYSACVHTLPSMFG